MKKLVALVMACILALPLFVLSGCFREPSLSTDSVYLNYIPTSSTPQYDGSFTEYIANEKSAAIVSIYSKFQFRNNKGSYSEDVVFSSGIILNDDGYILTVSSAVSGFFSGQSSTENVTVTSLSINLNPLYEASNAKDFSASVIDCNEELGLAIIKLSNKFYYYTDAEKTKTEQGFRYKGEFFDGTGTLKIGDDCAFVGDILDEGVCITTGVVSDDAMTVLGDIEFNGATYNYIQSTAALNAQMYGGALYDENGYIIGVTQTKIVSDTDNSVFNKIGLALPSACAVSYINSVADKLQTVIEYTVARQGV